MDMQNYTTPFANTGDREEFSIDTDPSGKVSLEKGWTELYQLRPEEGGLFILRKVFNQMMKLVSTDTVTWKTQTFPNWIDDKGDGLPFAYPKNAIVKATDGENYVSLEDNNEDNPIGSARWRLFEVKSTLENNITVDVGAGQTYTTINEALRYLTKTYYPMYKKGGITATINLKAGFVMNEQVLVSGINLGWITIVGEDAETIITHTALTTAFNARYPAFGVDKGGTSPIIGQLFRFNVEKVGGIKDGLFAYGAGSSADILSNCGFVGAGVNGIYAQHSSTVNASGANASNAGTSGISAAGSSTVNANGANASNAGTSGISASGSTVNASGVNASNAGTSGISVVNGSTVNASGANASNAGASGISVAGSSTVNISGSTIQNQTTGTARVIVAGGSTINAYNINTTGGTVPALSQTSNTLTANGIIFQ